MFLTSFVYPSAPSPGFGSEPRLRRARKLAHGDLAGDDVLTPVEEGDGEDAGHDDEDDAAADAEEAEEAGAEGGDASANAHSLTVVTESEARLELSAARVALLEAQLQLKRCEAEAAAAGQRIEKLSAMQAKHTAELEQLRAAKEA
jgi:hypothetical protein